VLAQVRAGMIGRALRDQRVATLRATSELVADVICSSDRSQR